MEERNHLTQNNSNLSWTLTLRQQCDVELILNGSFYPLSGFLTQVDYNSVIHQMRLSNGQLWPIPITLDIPYHLAEKLTIGDTLLLKDSQGIAIAALEVESLWEPDKPLEAQAVYGTEDKYHPGVRYLHESTHPIYIGGTLTRLPSAENSFNPLQLLYSPYFKSPWQLKQQFKALGWERIVAFQTRNPLHRAHYELTRAAMEQYDAKLLLQPVVGQTAPGDIDSATRIRCYEALMPYYPKHSVVLNLLPLSMRMAGPREALWHALIRQNYGATHFIIGRDHAGPGKDSQGKPFYAFDAAAELVNSYQPELSIQAVTFDEYVYVPSMQRYVSVSTTKSMQLSYETLSGTEVRHKLQANEPLPEWYSFPEVVKELQKLHTPKQQHGFTVFFTGLSGAGKSTLAQALKEVLEALGRKVTLLDGDEVRQHLSSELGFSKEHRDLNIRRLGYIAREITHHGGIAIVAAIAPYQAAREQARAMIEPFGGFIEVYLSTPLATCEARDVKGLYAKARKGELPHFTGIDDPYEVPEKPELIMDTQSLTIVAALKQILAKLKVAGYLTDSDNQQHDNHVDENNLTLKEKPIGVIG
jgi:sulfate adenylyltransferase